MDVIDTIQADQIENKDIISMDGDTIEVIEIVESEDPLEVSFRGYNLSTGDTEKYDRPFDYTINLLGA